MNGTFKRLVILVTTFALVMVPCMTCFAQDVERDEAVIAGQMAADALVARPLGLCATVIGGALFVVSLPFSLLGRNTGDAFNYLLADPFKFTFSRPLGDF
jgi:ABC-type molybdate transport system permease subunit